MVTGDRDKRALGHTTVGKCAVENIELRVGLGGLSKGTLESLDLRAGFGGRSKARARRPRDVGERALTLAGRESCVTFGREARGTCL